jgi:predicted MFS family arabinose efflux permease
MTRSPDSARSITSGVLLTLAGSAIYFLMPVYLGDMAKAMALGPQRMGVLGGAEIAAIAIASVLSSLWVRRVRWRTAALVGAAVTVVGDALTCLAHSYLPILVLRVLTGLLGEGILYPLSFVVLGQTRDPDRSFGIALSYSVGFLAAVLLASPWLTLLLGEAVLVIILGALAATVGAFAHWVPDPAVPAIPIQAAADTTSDTMSPGAVKLGLLGLWGLVGQAVWFIGPGGYWAFSERVAAADGLSGSTTATALSVGLAAGLIGCLIPARIGGKHGRIWPVMVSTLALIAVVLGTLQRSGAVLFILYIMAFNALWNLGTAYIFGLIASADRDGRLSVLIPASQSVGLALGPIIMGYLVAEQGMLAVGWSFAAAELVALAIFVPFARRVVQLPAPRPLGASHAAGEGGRAR